MRKLLVNGDFIKHEFIFLFYAKKRTSFLGKGLKFTYCDVYGFYEVCAKEKPYQNDRVGTFKTIGFLAYFVFFQLSV
ncbi:hypothetical protein FLJC2902T_15960 [Flavobacterium limnosediminis JC2902]|uniref:Uncharacterized protein n=1 Tax=Flavobacterium limnosediminis JC2902 TaxID=1341181 RepID=V6SP89_9FLAO|nr:hypothetical protein FLJC2902T_15960 [Flavobacterium limnosediminis JC2902]